VSGAWFRSMGNGSSLDKAEAYAYAAGDPHLASMVAAARRFGTKLHLTQAAATAEDALEAALERDIEATPAPTFKVCPACLGEGDSPHRPYFECDYCDGAGRVRAVDDA
jgi:DnaJ-class molecular chaperone